MGSCRITHSLILILLRMWCLCEFQNRISYYDPNCAVEHLDKSSKVYFVGVIVFQESIIDGRLMISCGVCVTTLGTVVV